ncbi:MAG TPA: hypothetical protein P5195_04465 [Anaerolineae bacterium]|nr:hypothetical protein [Anaerolineae bacterium]HRU94470.1 hypothetical protein [Anaerolineae bacterium]
MIAKTDAMFVHRRLVRKGELLAAHKVLQGLQKGVIRLSLSDASYAAECALEDAGATWPTAA